MKQYDFIGIGAQKAATSWISKCLDEHPGICVPTQKEVHFFSNEDQYCKGGDWYNEVVAECPGCVRGEYSTSYLTDPRSPKRIKEYSNQVKLIVSLRNPAERSLSHVRHLLSKKKIDEHDLLTSIIEDYPEIIDNSRYGAALERYLSVFHEEQILVILYDDIKKDPLRTIQSVYRFLGVNDAYIPKGVGNKHNTSRARTSPLYRYVQRSYNRLSRTRVGSTVIDLLRRLGINAYRIDRFASLFSPKERLHSSVTTQNIKPYIADDKALLLECVRRLGVTLPWSGYSQ